jgi:opacity protein-like surface antigen
MASLKALTLASVAVLALTRFASAADLLPPPPMPEPPPPVAEFSGWYLRGDIGMAVNASTPSLENSPDPLAGGFYQSGASQSFNNTTISASELADVGVGYQFNNWLRGDITGEYRDGGHFQSLYSLNNPNAGQGQTSQLLDFYRANTSSAVALANVYADLGTWYGMTPFVGGGVGVAYNRLSGMTDQGQVSTASTCFNNVGAAYACYPTGPSGGFFSNGATTNFAWALMAGVDFNITPNLKLELGYRYLNMGKISSGGTNCANASGQGNGFGNGNCGGGVANYVRSTNYLASNDFRIGLRWMIGDSFSPPPLEPAPLVRKY